MARPTRSAPACTPISTPAPTTSPYRSSPPTATARCRPTNSWPLRCFDRGVDRRMRASRSPVEVLRPLAHHILEHAVEHASERFELLFRQQVEEVALHV